MVLVKFYPHPGDFSLGKEQKVRLRKIVDELLADLRENYKAIIEDRFDGNNPKGQYYEIDHLDVSTIKRLLERKDPVYSIEMKRIDFQSDIYPEALLIRIG